MVFTRPLPSGPIFWSPVRARTPPADLIYVGDRDLISGLLTDSSREPYDAMAGATGYSAGDGSGG